MWVVLGHWRWRWAWVPQWPHCRESRSLMCRDHRGHRGRRDHRGRRGRIRPSPPDMRDLLDSDPVQHRRAARRLPVRRAQPHRSGPAWQRHRRQPWCRGHWCRDHRCRESGSKTARTGRIVVGRWRGPPWGSRAGAARLPRPRAVCWGPVSLLAHRSAMRRRRRCSARRPALGRRTFGYSVMGQPSIPTAES